MGESQDPHLQKRSCALPVSYPEPGVKAANQYYAKLLLEDYTGTVSEMTAINQYLYHYFTFHSKYQQLAELEECIAIIEMKHLELLAETILLLGVTPEFRTFSPAQARNIPAYWNASIVYYGINVCDRLASDITAEMQAIQNYRKHQQMIEDPYIKQLLERIIMDEQYHLKLFHEASAKYCHPK